MATIVADSHSLADVQTAIDSASAGDTVKIPAGDGLVTWGAGGAYLDVDKAITVKGPGTSALTIKLSETAGTGTSATIRIRAAATVMSFTVEAADSAATSPFSASTASGWRISDIVYDDTESGGGYFCYVGSSGPYGLIDNCVINGLNGFHEYIFAKGPTDSWQTANSIGGSDNLFIEDCTFTGSGACTDINANGRAVFRHNTITGKMKFDGHGYASNTPRGVRHVEVYNNHWTYTDASGSWFSIHLRGGGGRIFDNIIDHDTYGGIRLNEFGCVGLYSNFGNEYQCPADYPITDQIGVGIDPKSAASEPVYLWGNEKNGSPMTTSSDLTWDSVPAQAITDCDEGSWTIEDDIIVSGRDFYISEAKPAAMSGYTSYTYPHPMRTTNTLVAVLK